MNIEQALAYICEHQFDLDPEMRTAVYSIMNDRERKRRDLLKLIELMEDHICKLDTVNQRVIGMRKKLEEREYNV